LTVIKVRPHERFEGIYWVTTQDGARKLSTRNYAPGVAVYGEELVKVSGVEYRLWDAYRSKLAAAVLKNLENCPVRHGTSVLYLGAASGTTASHVSDIIGEEGAVYGIEFASRVMRELIERVSSHRNNVFPILEDARFPERYRSLIRQVDVVYCDIAQPDQARILAENSEQYLKQAGFAMIAIKSRSVDVTMSPADVFRQELEVLRARGYKLLELVRLEPYEKDHAMAVLTR
jgi:fibrillarin-like pre-rRNA processing protein